MAGTDRSDAALEVVLVAAVAENGVIGADGGMPWHYPADLRHFRETTTGHPVLVGRRTYEAIAARLGGPLPDRTSVVLTRSEFDPDDAGDGSVVVVVSVDEAMRAAGRAADERGVGTVYVVGGASVYEQFLPRADRLVITEVPDAPEGDTYFPEWDKEAWVETEREAAGDGDLAFVTCERARGGLVPSLRCQTTTPEDVGIDRSIEHQQYLHRLPE